MPSAPALRAAGVSRDEGPEDPPAGPDVEAPSGVDDSIRRLQDYADHLRSLRDLGVGHAPDGLGAGPTAGASVIQWHGWHGLTC